MIADYIEVSSRHPERCPTVAEAARRIKAPGLIFVVHGHHEPEGPRVVLGGDIAVVGRWSGFKEVLEIQRVQP